MTDQQWMHRGSCASGEYSPDLWFPEWGDAAAATKAKRVCGSCPVLRQCAEYAITFPVDLLGVWGGMARKEIRRERQRRNITPLSESDLNLLNQAARDAYGDDDSGV